ncbi:MAG: hypothetical protein ABIT09_02210 [Croceibacterium sp.]
MSVMGRHEFPFPGFEGMLHRLYAAVVFRRRFAAYGKGARVSPFAIVKGMGNVTIGPNSHVGRRTQMLANCSGMEPEACKIAIGQNTYVGQGCTLSAHGLLSIGNNITIGDNAYISAGQHAFANPGTRIIDQPLLRGEVEIADGAWIGYGAFISSTKRLLIGAGAVVAANAVVTRDVPALTMVGGTPARPIKRFDTASGEWRLIKVPSFPV